MQKKNIIELSITSFLIFVLLFAVINSVRGVKQAKRLKTKSKTAVLKKAAFKGKALGEKISAGESKGENEGLFRRLEEESKNLELRRDPFTASPITPTETSPAFQLNGIAWDEEEPIAIINGILVRIGDRIGSNVVVDIKKNKVILSDGANYFELLSGL